MSYYAQNKIKPTKEQSHMLNTFSKLCKEYNSYHSLKKNDILIVNNHLMLHSRGATNALYKNVSFKRSLSFKLNSIKNHLEI